MRADQTERREISDSQTKPSTGWTEGRMSIYRSPQSIHDNNIAYLLH